MEFVEQLFSLRKYVRGIGGPEPTLAMLEFLNDNKDDLPADYRKMFDDVMDGYRKMFDDVMDGY